MPPPFRVELVAHDPEWADLALREGERIGAALVGLLDVVHHIGSTAIPGIAAKPIIDLLPVVYDLRRLDGAAECLEELGYAALGEYGLPGRRYFIKVDPETDRRLINCHCYQRGSSEITRHLAFRDYLRQRPDLAKAYDAKKRRCQARHRDDHHAYTDCKDAWIKAIEAEALDHMASEEEKD